MKSQKALAYPYGAWMALFIVVPMGLMAFYAFRSANGSFSLANFSRFFEPMYLKVLGLSLWVAGLSTVFSLLIGYPAAYFITAMPGKTRDFYLILLILPMWMNFLLRTYSWMNLLGRNGLINKALALIGLSPANLLYNDGAIFLGMLYNFLPFMIYPIYSVLRKINASYLEAAKDLGASPWAAFWKVTFPLSMPGVISGIVMVFMPAASTFVIPVLLGGGGKMYIGNLIQHQFTVAGDWNFGSAVAILLMALILLSMTLLNKLDETGGRESTLW